jgi:hypothetical protein
LRFEEERACGNKVSEAGISKIKRTDYLDAYGPYKAYNVSPIVVHKVSVGFSWIIVFRLAVCRNQRLCCEVDNMSQTTSTVSIRG